MSAKEQLVFKFYNGETIPALGLGTWKSKPGEVKQAVKLAIDVGYRHIDCAHLYENEKEIGEAIAEKIKDGTVTRKELFITSKLWNTHHRADLVKGALKVTLRNLQVSYVDLYLMHWPHAYKEGDVLFPTDASGKIVFSDVDYVETWREMEKVAGAGLARSVGVSNFNARQLARLLQHATIKPVTNQVECHPYLSQARLVERMRSEGILLTAYSPLGSPDRPWASAGEPLLLEDAAVAALAAAHGKSPAQILIRYQMDRGHVVIPKSVSPARIASNFDVFDFKLSAADLAKLDALDCNGRFIPNTETSGHRHHPFENDEF